MDWRVLGGSAVMSMFFDDIFMYFGFIIADFSLNFIIRTRYFFWVDLMLKYIRSFAGRMGWDSFCATDGFGFM